MGNPYNGYDWSERMAKYDEQKLRIKNNKLDAPHGPCCVCHDPGGSGTGVTFEYHDEDYSEEYSWKEPASYMVCHACHIYRIHGRFRSPRSWETFLAHVGRGGYARDMHDPGVKKELAAYRAALTAGRPLPELSARNGGRRDIKGEWFYKLTCDVSRMSDRSQRPRP